MIKKINLIIATLYSIIVGIVERMLNWENWQYAPLWIVDYLIVLILLSAVFVFKENIQRLMLLLGWAFSSGVMYMVIFINLEPVTTTIESSSALFKAAPNVQEILPLVGLAFAVSVAGIILTMIDNKNN